MSPSVALAHDVLGARAGGERVLVALAAGFPDASIHTLIHEPSATFPEFAERGVQTSPLNAFGAIRRHYRAALPLAGPTWAATRIDADVTICSSSGLSHHARTTGKRIVYCHTPARWIYDGEPYLAGFGRGVRTAAALLRPPFRHFDRRAMRSADLVLANSRHIAREIQQIYGIDARVVPPASFLDIDGDARPIDGAEPGFVLSPMRPLAYKRFDVLVEAARLRPDLRFLHIGDGPNLEDLRVQAPPNLRSVGAVPDDQLRWAYRNATVAVLTAAEDFGLVPLEAAAHGLTTVAPNARGIRDHDPAIITPYRWGDAADLVATLAALGEPNRLRDHRRLGREAFLAAIHQAVADVLDEPARDEIVLDDGAVDDGAVDDGAVDDGAVDDIVLVDGDVDGVAADEVVHDVVLADEASDG